MRTLRDSSVRGLYRVLRPATRNSLRLALLLTAHDRSPKPVTAFTEKRILVLAPHADDEIIGCGGTLALHASSGADITVAYMTDGRWGDADLLAVKMSSASKRSRQSELIALRKEEARSSTALMGIRQLRFLDAEDSNLRPDAAITESLYRLLLEIEPDFVYLPFLMDGHEDHWQTNRVFYAALSRLTHAAASQLNCRGYEVWTPLVANRVVDISDVMELKLAALQRYQSQLKDVDYCRCVKGMNVYRAIHLGAKGFAEAFFECTAAEYMMLFQQMAA